MGTKVKKTEHTCAKHCAGAYWGPKAEAEKQCSRARRKNGHREIRAEGIERRPRPCLG
jgi:hypothetical protein